MPLGGLKTYFGSLIPEKINSMLEGMSRGSSGGPKDLQEAISERRQAEAETLRIYSGLATTGQMSSMLFSQLEHFIRRIQSEVALVRGDISFDSLDEGRLEDLRQSMGAIDELLHQVQGKMRRMDPLAKPGKSRRLRKVRLGDCVAAPLEAFQDLFAEADVTVELLGDDSVIVNSSSYVIQQALAPILDNALYWVRQRGRGRSVLVEIEPGSISVSNNGPSIPVEDLQRIFLPHFTRRPDATGLWLTLAQNLMDSIGGEVSHTSYTNYETFTIRVDRSVPE